jgi:hypothetical protein
MARSAKSGKQLERLIAAVEKTLAEANPTIEAPCRRLFDRDTGNRREHDIVITWEHAHHKLVMAIECRDRSRPVGVPDVEAFADKCAATGVDKGVIVSATGFRQTAITKAQSRSILCMTLSEAEDFDWIACTASMRTLTRHFTPVDLIVYFSNDDVPASFGRIFDRDGNEVEKLWIAQYVTNKIQERHNAADFVGKPTPFRVGVQTPRWYMLGDDGNKFEISHIMTKTVFSVEENRSPFRKHRYHGGGKEYAIASAEFNTEKMRGHVIMKRNDDDTTSVYLLPSPDSPYGLKRH